MRLLRHRKAGRDDRRRGTALGRLPELREVAAEHVAGDARCADGGARAREGVAGMNTREREVMDARRPTNAARADRLDQLVEAITTLRDTTSLLSEFSMRVPAEPKRDADLVLSEAAKRLRTLDAQIGRA